MELRLFNENMLTIQYFMRAGILILLIAQALTLSKHINRKGNLLMALFFILILGINLNDNEIFNSMGFYNVRFINTLLASPILFVPVCIYYSILYYINPNHILTRKELLLFLPWLIDQVASLIFYYNPNYALASDFGALFTRLYNWIVLPFLIAFSFYLWYQAYLSLKRHAQNIKLLHSSIEQVDLKWLLHFANCVPILFVSHLLRSIFSIELFYDIGDCIAFITIIYLGINLILQGEVYPLNITVDSIEPQPNSSKDGAIETGVVNPQLEDKAKLLEDIMIHKRPYLNSNLNLGELAFIIDVRPQELSSLLQRAFSTNFYSYVNRFRIERCKEMLSSPEYVSFSMEGIAKEAGFKSKSTFYTRFKEFTGLTPAQYIEAKSKK